MGYGWIARKANFPSLPPRLCAGSGYG